MFEFYEINEQFSQTYYMLLYLYILNIIYVNVELLNEIGILDIPIK